MSTLLTRDPTGPTDSDADSNAAPGAHAALASVAAQRLRASMAAVRLSFTWLGTTKSLTTSQKSEAALAFGAEGTFLSAGKKLLDTSHHAYRAVTGVRGRILAYWRGISLPYPEPGIRLIRQGDIGPFGVQLTTLQAELAEAVVQLDRHYLELRTRARERLGRLYSAADYPDSLQGLFEVSWDFPSVEPPAYLQQLSPELYRRESARVAARFDEAVRLAEQAFLEELARLVSHLTERLSGAEDGHPKVFRDSAIHNLTEFFERFRHLDLQSSPQLEELVTQAQQIVRGVGADSLRREETLRQHVATRLSTVQAALEGLLVDRPRRAILRGPRAPQEG